MQLELHFQDGFSGETIEVLVDGQVQAQLQLKTRYQINLAHVEQLAVEPAQDLMVRSADTGEAIKVPVDIGKAYYIISKRQEHLVVDATDQLTRYM